MDAAMPVEPRPVLYGLRPDLGVSAEMLIAQAAAARSLDAQRKRAARAPDRRDDHPDRRPVTRDSDLPRRFSPMG